MKHYAMKAYVEVDVSVQVFLTSALVLGEWPASLRDLFNPKEISLGTHWLRDWVDTIEEKSFLHREELRPLGRLSHGQSLPGLYIMQ
jgi:hypothetical protein